MIPIKGEQAAMYRVEPRGTTECPACGRDGALMWTIVDKEDVSLGQEWADWDLANDICGYMNMAYQRAMEECGA